ncbi:TetR/AcrR family transcriptional regulator [Faecalicatena contorta]|uniref:TetR/AcrR family transcriptional regulator n=1 Tax=Faecalicatena contorta TaxID=39482 RepID=UPI001F325492|nr:TetR/AcrR family transcriptional regulator [Faecalicatena contorta]MCF2683886.1 TetR/AcrR family transcriptional regulator [Faecalicatena contorta]
MRTVNEEAHRAKEIEIMETCFDSYAENGFTSVGVKAIAKACGCSSASLYQYFDNLDDLIVKSTEYCMSKVEDDFMAKAPSDVENLWRFIDEIPYWTAKNHGKKYRLMYQIYTHPKYREYGQKFFKGVDERYTEYAKRLEPKLGIPYEKLTPLIFILIRACVHYALFEDEFYMTSQIELLKETLELFIAKYNPKARSGIVTE